MKPIDLSHLNWDVLERVERTKPMNLHNFREDFRRELLETAEQVQLPRLAAWAQKATPLMLDMLIHLGFSEHHFWETLTEGPKLCPFPVTGPANN